MRGWIEGAVEERRGKGRERREKRVEGRGGEGEGEGEGEGAHLIMHRRADKCHKTSRQNNVLQRGDDALQPFLNTDDAAMLEQHGPSTVPPAASCALRPLSCVAWGVRKKPASTQEKGRCCISSCWCSLALYGLPSLPFPLPCPVNQQTRSSYNSIPHAIS